MTMTTYAMKGEVTSDCTCHYCPTCECLSNGITDYDPKCDLCDTPLTPAFETCYGECWDDSKYDFEENAFNPWCLANNADAFAIYGRRMGWTGSNGHTGRLTTFDALIKNLTLRGDFTLRWELSEDNKTLTVVRSSHDEMGAMFEVVPWNEGDDE